MVQQHRDLGLKNTQKLRAVSDGGRARFELLVDPDELRRWRAAAKRERAGSLAAWIRQVLGGRCDGMGIR